MKAVHGVFAASLLSVVCHAGIIPLETIKSVAHPKYKPDTYAQFGDHDVDCGHIAIVKRGDERKCQERCRQYSTLLKEDCNAYTFKPGKNGGESSCVLKNYRCRPSNWKKKHNSGLLGGCAYWCDKVPRGVDMSVCRNSDGSRWSCHSEDLQQGRQGGGKSQDTRRPENPKGPKHNAGGPKDMDHNGSPNDPKHPRQGGSNGPKDGNHTGGEGHHTGGRNNSHQSGDSDDHHHPEGNDHHHSGGSSDHHHSGGSNDPHHAGGGRDPKDPHHSGGSNGPKDPHHPSGPKDPKDPHHPGGPKDPHHPGGPKDPHHPGGPKNPHHPDHPDHPDQQHHPHHPDHPGPSQRAKPKPKPKANLGFPFGILRRDMSDACPAPMTACPVVKSDGTLGEGLDCVETDQDLNQCGGCLGTGGVDCEKIAHAEIVGCSSGRCKVLRCAEGFYAKGDTCFRKLGQIIFDNPNGY